MRFFQFLYLSVCLFVTILLVAGNDEKGLSRCGGIDHSQLLRPCANNDEVCGSWNIQQDATGRVTKREWKPRGCVYQDISSEQARKCLGNRTLAFIGIRVFDVLLFD